MMKNLLKNKYQGAVIIIHVVYKHSDELQLITHIIVLKINILLLQETNHCVETA